MTCRAFFDFRNPGKWYAEAVFGAQAGGDLETKEAAAYEKEKQKGRILAAVCMCSLAGLLLSGCEKNGSNKEAEQNLPEIVVGSDNYPPFNYIDKDGEATGIDVDLAEEAFARMGYRAVFESINWEEKKELLERARSTVSGAVSRWTDGRTNGLPYSRPQSRKNI